jgi:signal peptidase II
MAITFQRRRALAVCLIVGCGVVLDQLTKQIAQATLPEAGRIYLLGPLAFFEYAENTGGFLSLGSALPEQTRFWMLTVFTGGILAVLAGMLLFRRRIYSGDVIALSLLLTGGIGNLIDRIRFDGRVVDFMVLSTGGRLRTGVFNVADVAIMAGIFLLLGLQFLVPARHRGVTDGTDDT